jgi:hypothetical protein
MLIKLIMYIVNNINVKLGGFNGSSVIPSNLYPCNLLTPKWEPYYKNFFEIENPLRINRWTTNQPQIREAFSFWIKHAPSLFTFEYQKDLVGTLNYPRWVFDDHSTNQGINEQLIEDIKYLNGLSKEDLEREERLPDSVAKINVLSQDRGVDVNLQINNIMYWKYHRYNGDQLFQMYMKKGSKSMELGD